MGDFNDNNLCDSLSNCMTDQFNTTPPPPFIWVNVIVLNALVYHDNGYQSTLWADNNKISHRGAGGGVMDRCITILSEKSFVFVMIE